MSGIAIGNILSAPQADEIFGLLDDIVCDGNTWRAKGNALRSVFDLMLSYANTSLVRSGATKEFIEGFNGKVSLLSGYVPSETADKLDEIRRSFNGLQHNYNKYSDTYNKPRFGRQEFTRTLGCINRVVGALSSQSVPDTVLRAGEMWTFNPDIIPQDIMFVSEMCDRPATMDDGARFVKALNDRFLNPARPWAPPQQVRVYLEGYMPGLFSAEGDDTRWGMTAGQLASAPSAKVTAREAKADKYPAPVNGALDSAIELIYNLLNQRPDSLKWVIWRAYTFDLQSIQPSLIEEIATLAKEGDIYLWILPMTRTGHKQALALAEKYGLKGQPDQNGGKASAVISYHDPRKAESLMSSVIRTLNRMDERKKQSHNGMEDK